MAEPTLAPWVKISRTSPVAGSKPSGDRIGVPLVRHFHSLVRSAVWETLACHQAAFDVVLVLVFALKWNFLVQSG